MSHTARWTQPQTNTDGSPFTAEQFAGYELELNGQPAVSVPIGWDADGAYEFDLRLVGLPYGQHRAKIRVVNKQGAKSDFSNEAVFEYKDERVPSPPLGFSVG